MVPAEIAKDQYSRRREGLFWGMKVSGSSSCLGELVLAGIPVLGDSRRQFGKHSHAWVVRGKMILLMNPMGVSELSRRLDPES